MDCLHNLDAPDTLFVIFINQEFMVMSMAAVLSNPSTNPNLMIICDDKSALQKVLTLAGMFGLSATNAQSPILDMGTHKIAVLNGEDPHITDAVLDMLKGDIKKVHGFNAELRQGSNSLPTMQVHLH